MSPLDVFEHDNDALLATIHRSQSSRRLSDKILAAFSHAYAVGEHEVADKLKDALAASEAKHARRGDKRRSYDPLGQAGMWVAFVEARNGYRALVEDPNADADRLAVALDAMKEAYRRWSAS
jgi:hypothetical protein